MLEKTTASQNPCIFTSLCIFYIHSLLSYTNHSNIQEQYFNDSVWK